MAHNTDILKRFTSQIWYFIIIPVSFFLFILLYTPFETKDLLSSGRDLFAFNTTMLTSILLVFMVCARLGFHFIWRNREISVAGYSFWCLGEAVAAAFFMALYLYLMNRSDLPYFSVLGSCIKLSILTSIYPYLLITLLLLLQTNMLNSCDTVDSFQNEDNSLIRFTDTSQRLKLAIAPSSVVYVEAEENYVRIHYLENGRLSDYVLRNSMKNVEDIVGRSGLVRSHRSFIVNPSHVKLLRKDKEGVIVADFDVETAPVPVSKKYYDNLVNLLS